MPNQTILPILQGELKGKKWIVGSSNFECLLGSYEYKKRELFESLIKNSKVVYDVGANVGFYTLLASEILGNDGKVIAFEPLPRNITYLKKHVKLNRCNNVQIIEAAVSDRDNFASFSEGKEHSQAHLSKKGEIKVKVVSIDSLVNNNEIKPPNLIKMDIEGAELLALKGSVSSLVKYSPQILLATHGHDIHQECCKFLESLNYKINLIDKREIFAYKE